MYFTNKIITKIKTVGEISPREFSTRIVGVKWAPSVNLGLKENRKLLLSISLFVIKGFV